VSSSFIDICYITVVFYVFLIFLLQNICNEDMLSFFFWSKFGAVKRYVVDDSFKVYATLTFSVVLRFCVHYNVSVCVLIGEVKMFITYYHPHIANVSGPLLFFV